MVEKRRIANDEWEEFVRCLYLGLRMRSGAQMRNVCTAELLDLSVFQIVSFLPPQDFAAHISGSAGIEQIRSLYPIAGLKGLELGLKLEQLSVVDALPIRVKPGMTRLAAMLAEIAGFGAEGAEYYMRVALILGRARGQAALRNMLYIPRATSQADSLQLTP